MSRDTTALVIVYDSCTCRKPQLAYYGWARLTVCSFSLQVLRTLMYFDFGSKSGSDRLINQDLGSGLKNRVRVGRVRPNILGSLTAALSSI